MANDLAAVAEVRPPPVATEPALSSELPSAYVYDCCSDLAHASSVEPTSDYDAVVNFSDPAIDGRVLRAFSSAGEGSVAPNSAVRCLANSFVSGTEVLMADGSTKPIEDVEIGDWVWATDPETGETGPRQVVDTIVGDGEKKLVDLEVLGDTIIATDGHPFWVDSEGRWVDADDLEVGDQLLLADGRRSAITAIDERSGVQRVHNLTVDGIHTYYVEAADEHVLVHNSGPCSVGEVAANLRARAGKNRVEIETPDGRMTIDLEGSSHFEKSLQTDIGTPHVKFETRHVGPNGNVSYTSGPVRSATHDDLRLVDRILSERGL